MRKKIAGLLSALALCLAVAPAAAFAESNWTGWTELTAGTAEIGGTAGAKYYLNNDVTVGGTLQIKGGTEESPVVLDLNGHTLSGAIKVDGGACLMLKNSSGATAGGTTCTGQHTDESPKDHLCDVCGTAIGICADADKDHKCDYGCGTTFGTHEDADLNHVCDYGCKEAIGVCADADKDHKCDYGCGKTFGVCSGGTATCKDKAVCDYCGKPYGELDSSTHAGGTYIENDKAATCNEDGYTGDTYCKGCATKLQDGKPITKLGHIDADKNHVCDRENCKATLSTCSGGTATCKDKAVCDYCGKPYGDFDNSTHASGTEVRNAKGATCTEDGYTGDTYCKGCETKLSSGKSVDKTGHDYESKVTKEATTTSTGTKTYTCKNCGHSYEEEIAKLSSSSHSGDSAEPDEPDEADEPLAKTGEPDESDEPLAKTGDSAPASVAVATALMLAGGAVVLAARRRCA